MVLIKVNFSFGDLQKKIEIKISKRLSKPNYFKSTTKPKQTSKLQTGFVFGPILITPFIANYKAC